MTLSSLSRDERPPEWCTVLYTRPPDRAGSEVEAYSEESRKFCSGYITHVTLALATPIVASHEVILRMHTEGATEQKEASPGSLRRLKTGQRVHAMNTALSIMFAAVAGAVAALNWPTGLSVAPCGACRGMSQQALLLLSALHNNSSASPPPPSAPTPTRPAAAIAP